MTASTAKSRQPADQRLFGRQKQLLTLLDAVGGRASNLDFQKLLFLYCQEESSGELYQFVPYRFGAFSFTSYADRQKLVGRGLLVDDEKHWQLTDEGSRIAGGSRDLHIADFARRHQDLRGDALVAETYRRFPYYATRSEIAERVLGDDENALQQIDAARPRPMAAALSTIGYEGRTLESYLNALLQAGVTLLCDVRRNPISRKYGFSKRTLASGCERVGILYEHLPELGIASEKRRNLETQADYDELFDEYATVSLPKQGEAVSTIEGWIRSGERVALTCYERLPQHCHRSCLAVALAEKADKRLLTNHL